MKTIWAEKHRPSNLENFVGQETINEEIGAILNGDAPMQHYLFHSPEPGTGKTSLAYIMAKSLGYQLHKFNASSKKQRGIEFVEEEIAPLSRLGQWETIFFLDEADRVTPQAQDALKGVIEDACGYFILTCNDLSRVSPWLQSRCQVRTFQPIDEEAMLSRLSAISAIEGVDVKPDDLTRIAKKHKGDLRNAIGALQTASYFEGRERERFLQSLEHTEVDVQRFLRLCFVERAFEEATSTLDVVNPRPLIREIFLGAMISEAKSESKMLVADAASQAERDIILGVNPQIAAYAFVSTLCSFSKS